MAAVQREFGERREVGTEGERGRGERAGRRDGWCNRRGFYLIDLSLLFCPPGCGNSERIGSRTGREEGGKGWENKLCLLSFA